MIGTTIKDKYEITKRIGKGAFGEVYLARDVGLKRDVAIKFLLDPGEDNSFRERFLRESESMARMLHPNVVTVFDCGEHDGRPFLVMEYVDGSSLMEVVRDSTLLPGEAVRFGRQIARGMIHAHKHGIVHRDLTLRNIMINSEGQAKVLDFGLVKMVGSKAVSVSGLAVGTPGYLAPEQAAAGDVDGRADIFSFGVCLYRLTNGRFPFDAEHPAAILYRIANEDPDPFVDAVPDAVRDVVLKCLEKAPADRYQSFEDILADLSALTSETEGAESGAVTRIEISSFTAKRSSKRNPYLNRVMIESSADFFGRKREVKRIFSRLDAPRPQSISVVGERRVGKSSLLNFVYQRKNRRRHMENHSNAIFVYLDFQRGQAMDTTKFIEYIFGMFDYEKYGDVLEHDGAPTLDQLKEAVERLSADGKRIIILMDEFESITTNPNFDMQFFSFLRFLANNYKVAYITSSYNDLQQMCHDKEIADSPFFNIFSNLHLRPFTRDEALELIHKPSQRESVPLESYAENILDLSGFFPFFIQIACSNAFEYLVENEGAEPDWAAISESFMEEASPHFSFIWDKLDDNARENLARVATGRPVDRKFRYVNEDLQRRGYLQAAGDGVELFSKSFRDFVVRVSGAGKKRRSFLGGLLGRRGSG